MRPVESPTESRVSDAESAEFLRMASVMRRIGLGRSTIYRLIAAQSFPAPVKLAGRAVGWRRTDYPTGSNLREATGQHG